MAAARFWLGELLGLQVATPGGGKAGLVKQHVDNPGQTPM
jgi:hypothetical protein